MCCVSCLVHIKYVHIDLFSGSKTKYYNCLAIDEDKNRKIMFEFKRKRERKANSKKWKMFLFTTSIFCTLVGSGSSDYYWRYYYLWMMNKRIYVWHSVYFTTIPWNIIKYWGNCVWLWLCGVVLLWIGQISNK